MSIDRGLKEFAGLGFNYLFDCIIRVSVYEALVGADEDEEEEYSSTGASLLPSICAVGRTHFASALHTIYR